MSTITLFTDDNKWYVAITSAIALTLISYFAALYFGWIDPANFDWRNWVEVIAVFTGYACTILCNYQSRWNYPIGIVCQISYFAIMLSFGSYGLAFFNLYLVATLAYGFWYWKSDTDTTPVTNVAWKELALYVIFGLGVLALFYGVLYYFDPMVFESRLVPIMGTQISLVHVDAIIAAVSGVAQFLLDRKKIQTWMVWVLVNIVSIPYYFYIEFYFVAFQYIFFLANTYIGYQSWKKTMS